MLDSGNKAVTYVFSNLVREDDRELEEESEETGEEGRRYEEGVGTFHPIPKRLRTWYITPKDKMPKVKTPKGLNV